MGFAIADRSHRGRDRLAAREQDVPASARHGDQDASSPNTRSRRSSGRTTRRSPPPPSPSHSRRSRRLRTATIMTITGAPARSPPTSFNRRHRPGVRASAASPGLPLPLSISSSQQTHTPPAIYECMRASSPERAPAPQVLPHRHPPHDPPRSASPQPYHTNSSPRPPLYLSSTTHPSPPSPPHLPLFT